MRRSNYLFALGLFGGYLMLILAAVLRQGATALCLAALVWCLGLVFLQFARRQYTSREVVLLCVLTCLATLSRVIFYFTPQIKPMSAVVIVCGACFGPGAGGFVGLFSALLSNFVFGQGVFTPFQMMGLAAVGFLAGLLFFNRPVSANNPWVLIYAFLSVMLLYGLTVDTSSVLFLARGCGATALAAVYLAGIPFNFLHAVSTVLFLALFGNSFQSKCLRAAKIYKVKKI